MFMVGFFMFLERGSRFMGLVEADFLRIFVGFGANPASIIVLGGAYFDFEVAKHSTNTIKRHYYISPFDSYSYLITTYVDPIQIAHFLSQMLQGRPPFQRKPQHGLSLD